MSLFSLILGTIVFVYTVFYVIRTVKPLLRYKCADKIKIVKGRIIKKQMKKIKRLVENW